ncbi:SDR family oxidoreductase [Rhizobiales bacterium TNE-4]|nr:SDR family oxidoreductase [Rhizobiales bacterium TNE-4]MBV1828595.1 SDR family oxidoreductase [Rhizobiales bacterium TNE-4]
MKQTSPFRLDGKTILITGASSGIGQATAIMASYMGAKTILLGRNCEKLKETYDQLNGPSHEIVVSELTEPHLLPDTFKQFNSLDGAVFSAGTAEVVPFRMINVDHITRIMNINFESPINCVKHLIKNKSLNKGASIVFITAVANHISPVGSAIYSASKAALEAAARSIALEVSKNRIRLNCLSPGYVQTPMFDQLAEKTKLDELINLTPLGIIQPKYIATSAIFLLSPASRWVTRSTLTVDGGLTIGVR